MKHIFPMTIEGEKKLRNELNYLKNIKRPKIINEIYEARKYGDLKENYEYHIAREQQIFCENRIKEIENKLFNSLVIDIKKIKNINKVVFGSTIIIKNLFNNNINKYHIVGDEESDLNSNKISINSPIAKCFIGKEINYIACVNTPSGNINYQLLEIKYV